MLLVSLLGAPAFAVGNRRRAPRTTVRRRRRRRHAGERAGRARRRRRWHRRLPGGKTLTGGAVIYWWLEIIAVLTFYFVYSAVRNADAAHPERVPAREAAHRLAEVARHQPRAHDPQVGAHFKPLIVARELLLRLAALRRDDRRRHLPVPEVAERLPALAQHARDRHRDRAHRLPLLAAHAAAPAARTRYGFVDTLAKYPTFWTFNSGAMKKISNQYAAMPSVHCCWALWCACALVPRLKHTWAKWLAALYPALTVSVIVDHREPLLPRRGRRLHHLRHRLRRRPAAHPGRPARASPAVVATSRERRRRPRPRRDRDDRHRRHARRRSSATSAASCSRRRRLRVPLGAGAPRRPRPPG